jgi:hypothetical protein
VGEDAVGPLSSQSGAGTAFAGSIQKIDEGATATLGVETPSVPKNNNNNNNNNHNHDN